MRWLIRARTHERIAFPEIKPKPEVEKPQAQPVQVQVPELDHGPGPMPKKATGWTRRRQRALILRGRYALLYRNGKFYIGCVCKDIDAADWEKHFEAHRTPPYFRCYPTFAIIPMNGKNYHIPENVKICFGDEFNDIHQFEITRRG